VIFDDKKDMRSLANTVKHDFSAVESKEKACHDHGCDDLGKHLKQLIVAIDQDSTNKDKQGKTTPPGSQPAQPAPNPAAANPPTQPAPNPATAVNPPAQPASNPPATNPPAQPVPNPPATNPPAQPAPNPPAQPAPNPPDNSKPPTADTKKDNGKKRETKPPPPAPPVPPKPLTFYEKLKSALNEGKNDGEVEKILTDHIINNDAGAQDRIFYPLKENDKTKHFFISENHPTVGEGTGNSWLALLGMCLLGMCIGSGGLFAFLKRKEGMMSPDQIKAKINDSFKRLSENGLKQNIILEQIGKLDTQSNKDPQFYQELGETAIQKLDKLNEDAKQAFLLKQIQVETTPDNKHLPIAQSIVNQLDSAGKKKLGIGGRTSGGYTEPSTPADKASQMLVWLKDPKVKNHESLSGIFTPPVAPEGTYFLGEVLTAAGPRKTEEDELGEDIAGMMMKGDYAIFWIMDGSSNYSKIKNAQNQEIYSSRVLAMTLAEQVQILMRQKSNLIGSQVNHYLKEAIRNTISELNEHINKPAIKSLIQRANNGNNITVATTVTLGLLHKNGDLSICKIGDDKIAAGGEMINSKYGALMICDVQSELDVLKVDMAQLKEDWFEEYHIHHVQTVIASSDGINDTIYKWIQNNKQVSPDQIKRFKEHKNQTFDDKSLCIIQIINNK
jgi:hypothetical protein